MSWHRGAPWGSRGRRLLLGSALLGAVAWRNIRLLDRERRTVRRLRELDAVRSGFLAAAQHELRTPMLAIMGQLELIALAWDRWDDATKLDLIREIDASTRMLSDLMETVVDFTRLSSETVGLRITGVDAGAAIEATIGDIARRFKDGIPVTIGLELAPGLRVRADERRFRQVISNLLDNAITFTPEGGAVRVAAHSQSGDRIVIVVSDTGAGIAAEALPRIFDPFTKNDGPARSHGGAGMGLAVVRALCEAHKATIDVRSAQGRGTEVTLRWPAAGDLGAVVEEDGFHLVDV